MVDILERAKAEREKRKMRREDHLHARRIKREDQKQAKRERTDYAKGVKAWAKAKRAHTHGEKRHSEEQARHADKAIKAAGHKAAGVDDHARAYVHAAMAAKQALVAGNKRLADKYIKHAASLKIAHGQKPGFEDAVTMHGAVVGRQADKAAAARQAKVWARHKNAVPPAPRPVRAPRGAVPAPGGGGPWDEAKHPRGPAGGPGGGKFT